MRLRGRHRLGPLLLGAALLVLPACGLRTAPQPLSNRIPAPQEVRIWTRDSQVVVGWRTLPERQVKRWEGVSSYRIAIARLPLGCNTCDPIEERQLELAPSAKEIVSDREITAYPFTPSGPPATWEVKVAVEFNAGTGPESRPVRVDAVGNIPSERLRWERITPETLGSQGKPGIRFYWAPRRERIVHVVTKGGGQENLDVLYRINLYRRIPPHPWSILPANRTPIEGLFWIAPESYVVNDPNARFIEYQLRLVDQLGNEGPASDAVVIPIEMGTGT